MWSGVPNKFETYQQCTSDVIKTFFQDQDQDQDHA